VLLAEQVLLEILVGLALQEQLVLPVGQVLQAQQVLLVVLVGLELE
jgi:hypothetical protein